MLISALSASLSGISAASKRAEVSADNISRLSVENAKRKTVIQKSLEKGGVETQVSSTQEEIDLPKESSEQITAKFSNKANIRAYQVVQEMMDDVIHIADKSKK